MSSERERFDRELAAWRDGELSRLQRLRVERRLRREPDAQRRLGELETAGHLLKELDREGPSPDLWEAIRLRLPALDAQRAEAAAGVGSRSRGRRALGWSAAGALAAAAATVAVVLRLGVAPLAPGPVPPRGSVRWLDARGLPMMVLRDDAEATIIWVPEREADARTGQVEARDGWV